MGYFRYTCKKDDHSHSIETDIKIRSKKRLKCKYCGSQMQQVQYGFEEKKEDAE